MKSLFSKGIVLLALATSIVSCKKNSDVLPQSDINVVNSATLGKYLTNKNGQTLYIFANDADGTVSCTGACANLWPPVTVDLLSALKFDTSLLATDFTVVAAADGKNHLAYKGWPLYTHSPLNASNTNVAEATGAITGDGFNGLWFVAKPDYTVMFANKQLTGLDGNNYKGDYTVGTGNTTYFTNGYGFTLYTFSVDSFNINKFTKPDLSNYATFPLYEPNQIVAPSILDKTLFGSITVAGHKQFTYNGWPLYFYGLDNAVRGSNKAVSFPVPGKWKVAVKDITSAPR